MQIKRREVRFKSFHEVVKVQKYELMSLFIATQARRLGRDATEGRVRASIAEYRDAESGVAYVVKVRDDRYGNHHGVGKTIKAALEDMGYEVEGDEMVLAQKSYLHCICEEMGVNSPVFERVI